MLSLLNLLPYSRLAMLHRFFLLLLLAFPLTALHAADPIVEKTLGNGLKVIVLPDHRAAVAVQQAWYRAGSMDESYGTTGVAHVLEHMMFKGTPKVPAGEFSRRIAALGGRENAFTSRDHTAYFQTVQASRLPQAMALEADRMTHLSLDADEFAKELDVVKEERRMRTEDNPHSRLYEQLMASAFVAHPYRHPVIGWMNDLDNLTVADARAWYSRWYTPNNAILVIAGDVDPAQVFAWAEQHYGTIPAREIPARKPQTEPAPQGMRHLQLKAPAKLPMAILAWRAPKLESAHLSRSPHALEILAGVLSGHEAARLPQALVKTRHIALEANAKYDALSRGPALFTADVSVAEGGDLNAAIAALKGEISRVAREGISPAELARVKAQVLAAQVFEQDSLFYRAMQIGSWETAGLSWRDRATWLDGLKSVTAAEVQAAAANWLTDDRLTLAELVPQPMPENAPPTARGSGGRHAR
jgi:zinc protease